MPPSDVRTSRSAGAVPAITTSAAARVAGRTAIGGAAVMLAGAALYFSSGADIEVALTGGAMASYLDVAAGNPALVANLSLWIIGATLMGVSGIGFALLGRDRLHLGGVGAALGLLGAATAVTCFVAWLAVIVVVAPTGDVELATAMAWFAYRLDAVATALIVGFAPMMYSLAGSAGWAPRWLVRWGWLAGAVGGLSLALLFVPGLEGFGLIIVPVGIGWMIAGGVTALRQAD